MFLPPDPSIAVLDQVLASHRGLSRLSAHVVRTDTTGGKAHRVVAELKVVLPDQVLLRLKADGSDRSFAIRGTTLTAVDAISGEYLVQPGLKGKDLGGRLGGVVGPIGEPISLLVSPKSMEAWLTMLKSPGWKLIKGAGLVLSRSASDQKVSIAVDGRTHLLKGADIRSGSQSISWRVDYGVAPKAVALAIPKGAVKVPFFRETTQGVIYASAEARAAVQRMWRTMGHMASGSVRVMAADGSTTLAFGNKRYLQVGASSSWAYNGGVLTVRSAKGLFAAKVPRGRILDGVSASGGRVDPFMRTILLGAVPFSDLVSTGDKVTVRGKITIGGKACTIIEVKAHRRRETLYIGQDGHVLSVSTDMLANSGEVVSTAMQRYVYGPMPGAQTFALKKRPNEFIRPLILPASKG